MSLNSLMVRMVKKKKRKRFSSHVNVSRTRNLSPDFAGNKKLFDEDALSSGFSPVEVCYEAWGRCV